MAKVSQVDPSCGDDGEDKVRTLFSEIAPRYDLLNHILSLNIDRSWRRKAVELIGWQNKRHGNFLDACTGTFDLSLELAHQPDFQGMIFATDFAFPMLLEGRGKLCDSVKPVCGDSLRLPFLDSSFDGITIGFGVRNLSDLEAGLNEMARVLRPGARLVVLEFTYPPNKILRFIYQFYFHKILPILGSLISGHPWAYTYLPESLKDFPDPEELASLMRNSGFKNVDWQFLTGGIVSIHVGVYL